MKIYSYRVDSIHSETFKVLNGLNRTALPGTTRCWFGPSYAVEQGTPFSDLFPGRDLKALSSVSLLLLQTRWRVKRPKTAPSQLLRTTLRHGRRCVCVAQELPRVEN